MNNIKCLYALCSMCRGTVAQRGRTLCSYSQPVIDSTPTVSFVGPSDICQSQVVPPSINPRPFIKTKFGFFPQKCPVTGIHGNSPCVQGGGMRVFPLFFLRIDGDDFTATASHQEDPVQTLEENLQELHVYKDSSQGIKHTEPVHQSVHTTSFPLSQHCPSQ